MNPPKQLVIIVNDAELKIEESPGLRDWEVLGILKTAVLLTEMNICEAARNVPNPPTGEGAKQ